jgi:hypothetical protein
VASLADLLDPAARHRLERLAEPEDGQDLAAAASTGPGRTAWFLVALALDLGDTTTAETP